MMALATPSASLRAALVEEAADWAIGNGLVVRASAASAEENVRGSGVESGEKGREEEEGETAHPTSRMSMELEGRETREKGREVDEGEFKEPHEHRGAEKALRTERRVKRRVRRQEEGDTAHPASRLSR